MDPSHDIGQRWHQCLLFDPVWFMGLLHKSQGLMRLNNQFMGLLHKSYGTKQPHRESFGAKSMFGARE